jgi:hypothetical protein
MLAYWNGGRTVKAIFVCSLMLGMTSLVFYRRKLNLSKHRQSPPRTLNGASIERELLQRRLVPNTSYADVEEKNDETKQYKIICNNSVVGSGSPTFSHGHAGTVDEAYRACRSKLRKYFSFAEDGTYRCSDKKYCWQHYKYEGTVYEMMRNRVTDIKFLEQEIQSTRHALYRAKLEQKERANRLNLLEKYVMSIWAKGQANPSMLAAAISATSKPLIWMKNNSIASDLQRCHMSLLSYSQLPELERYSKARCGLGLRSFVPLRRESTFGKLLFCLGKHKIFTTYVDVFTSWGGSGLLILGGMINSTNSRQKTLVGWEIDAEVHEGATLAYNELLANKPLNSQPYINITHGSTMKPFTITGTIESTKGGIGSLVDYCKLHGRADVIFSDSDNGTQWKLDDGKTIDTQELFVLRDQCKPKILCLMNTLVNGNVYHPDKYQFYKSMQESKEYALLVEGDSYAVGCVDVMFDNRMFACYIHKAMR